MHAEVLKSALNRVDMDLDASLERLFALLRIPSISTDSAFNKDCDRAAEHLKKDLDSLGFKARVQPTCGHAIVVGHRPRKGAPHFLFYGHYDVQPVDPLSLWEVPPFEPRIVEISKGRKVIKARGACDDKGQVMTFLEACRAWIAAGGDIPVGLTVILEGDEENRAEPVEEFLSKFKSELKADAALVCDSGQWDRETPAVTTMLRGMCHEEIVIRCADRDLHSGLYGGAAQNPLHVISRIVGELKGRDGKIKIPGFYNGVKPLPKKQLTAWKKLGLTEKNFLGPIGLRRSQGEKGKSIIEQITSRPTCDVNGIWGGYQGEGCKTVIPSEAHAKVSFRLVGSQDPVKVLAAFRKFVQQRVPKDCTVEFKERRLSSPVSLPGDSALVRKAVEALTAEWKKQAVVIGSGGSVPIVTEIKKRLGLDSLLVGFGLDDDRLHSPNEKYDVSSFHHGTRSWVRILQALAH